MEVILTCLKHKPHAVRILHVCGGDPNAHVDGDKMKVVFSTYVEVIPFSKAESMAKVSILHVCGGDPKYYLVARQIKKYSPRMWR